MLEKGSQNATIMKRLGRAARALIVVAFLVAGTGVSISIASAQGLSTANASLNAASTAAGVAAGADLFTVIGRIINAGLTVVGVLLLVYLLWAGYLWMTASGDIEKVKRAKLMIRNAIIGLVIIASAFAITAYILSLLEGAGLGGIGPGADAPGAVGGFPGSAGSLGRGIIEYHLPPRDATGVPRNTSIIITFKVPIRISSIVKDYADSAPTTGLNSDTFKIYPTASPSSLLASDQARVHFTADHKTFVIKPVCPPHCLGSATANTNYTVELAGGSGGLLREDGQPAFTGGFSSGYKWQFQVSTVMDLTPPRITSVIPSSGGQYAPNIVVQINFSKPIDPTTAAGVIKDGSGFTNIALEATPVGAPAGAPAAFPNGAYKVSNQYTTVEFVSDLPCGINSCGRKIYCLPSHAAISVLAKAATLSQDPPQAELTAAGYDGITDFVGNSLDGNGNGKAEGPPLDNYAWSFGTSDKPNLKAPIVTATQPPAAQGGNAPVDQPPSADFDSVLQASTISSDSVYLNTSEPAQYADTFWFTPRQILLNASGGEATSTDAVVSGRVSIQHRVYLPKPKDKHVLAPEYDPFYLSDLQNVYQNCFNPAASAACAPDAGQNQRNCCSDRPSDAACPYPVLPPQPGS